MSEKKILIPFTWLPNLASINLNFPRSHLITPPHTPPPSPTFIPKMPTAVSAPGKVLLAGGYLVLDRDYTGLVFGLSARIHVLVHDIASSSGVEISEIIVHSPQFQAASWNYGYNLLEGRGGVRVTQLQGYECFCFCERLL